MKRLIKSILFDFDGTLIDSEHFHFTSWNIILKEYGHDMTYDYYNEYCVGVPATQNVKDVINRYNLPITDEELLEKGEQLTRIRMSSHQPVLMPFAMELVTYFHDLGLPLAIVTGSPRIDLDDTLSKVPLRKYFDQIITRTDVVKSKPDPESYLRAIEVMGFKAEEYLVLEDTYTGSQSAKAAGLTCIGVQSHTIIKKQLERVTDAVFGDLMEAKEYIVANYQLG
ncbi:MAG: HAD family phosphatase [Cyclobacteriaceae bacterium]